MIADRHRQARWRVALCALAGLATLSAGVASRARADGPLRVVVRVASATDRAILPRVRGQLSDVNAQLIVVETSPLEPAFADQVQTAHVLAGKQSADVVLWFASFRKETQTVLVHVATPREERILTRRLHVTTEGAAAGAPDKSSKLDSSLLEAAALAVRSAVSALVAGGSIGVSTEEAVANPPLESVALASTAPPATTSTPPSAASQALQPSAAGVPTPPPANGTATAPAEPVPAVVVEPAQDAVAASSSDGDDEDESKTRWHALGFVGAQSVIDGESSYGQRGVYLRAGVGYGALWVSAYGSVAFPARIDDQYFTLEVARHAVGGALSLRGELTRALSINAGVHAGAALFDRSSTGKTPLAQSAPAKTTAALALGPEASLDYMFGYWGVGLRFALDVLPNAPRFASSKSSSAPDDHQLWSVEPRIGLGLQAGLP